MGEKTSVQSARNSVQHELSLVGNIKKKETKKQVEHNLKRLLNLLDENGCAYFVGAGRAEKVRPADLQTTQYRCGKVFWLEPLERYTDEAYEVGVILVDAHDACVAFFNHSRFRGLWSDSSMVPRKHRKGGWSQSRYQRLREGALKSWHRLIADKASSLVGVKRLIVAGPGLSPQQFLANVTLDHRLPPTEVINIEYTDESGLHQMLNMI